MLIHSVIYDFTCVLNKLGCFWNPEEAKILSSYYKQLGKKIGLPSFHIYLDSSMQAQLQFDLCLSHLFNLLFKG